MSAITDTIRSKGFWDVAIRPEPFVDSRVDYGDLEDIVSATAVRLRGWPVPLFDYADPVLRGDDWIGQDIDGSVVAH